MTVSGQVAGRGASAADRPAAWHDVLWPLVAASSWAFTCPWTRHQQLHEPCHLTTQAHDTSSFQLSGLTHQCSHSIVWAGRHWPTGRLATCKHTPQRVGIDTLLWLLLALLQIAGGRVGSGERRRVCALSLQLVTGEGLAANILQGQHTGWCTWPAWATCQQACHS
jgi:hypothetical protein